MYIDIQLRHPADQRPPQPRVPLLRDPGRRLIMALPVPNLDDRRFQDLVDDAKRLVQQRCPEWSDHNVSDPGVTLIELFAWMTDQVVYRLNRVPDRNYVKFLELIGVSLYPPTAARSPMTFWLSAPAARRRHDPAGDPGGHGAHRHRRGDRVRDDRGPADHPVRAGRAGLDDRRQDAPRPHGRPREGHRGLLLPEGAVRPATRCTSACPRRSRRTRSGCGSRPTSMASASTRRTRRWPGRRGPATTGSRASSTPTPPAGSTATATW